jgi:N-acetylglucosamine-6-sulfatase
LLHPSPGAAPPQWRTAALVEHHGPDGNPLDPDFESGYLGGNPSSYEAIRIFDRRTWGNAVYAEYTVTGEREFYNIDRDPFERDNVYPSLTPAQKARLHDILVGLETCHGARACWAAGVPAP